jgi:hypothetical protein
MADSELERLYQEYSGDETRVSWLSYLFGFVTYDSELDEILVKRCLDVCDAVTNKTTFEYIAKSDDDRLWYTVVLSFPFFAERVEWGTSIRGTWWRTKPPPISEGNFDIRFDSVDDWVDFLAHVKEFLSVES